MPHPTIDLLQEPDTDCPQPVYNCVKYCFHATEFQTQTGTKASFTIEMPIALNGFLPNIPFTVSSQDYLTGVQNTYNEVFTTPPLTQTEFADNMVAALNANSFLFDTYDIVRVLTEVVGTAREIGIVDNFTFDFTDPGFAGVPPTHTETAGTEDEYRTNYRVVVEIWVLIWDTVAVAFVPQKVSTEAYTPNSDGEICINIGQKVSSFVNTRFVYDDNLFTTAFDDMTISRGLFIRYGEIYSDNVGECEVAPRQFVSSDIIGVINSAFQRGEDTAKIAKMCAHSWMTNAPQFTEVSECSEFVLWVNLDTILPAPPTAVTVKVKYIITYTDGTSTTHLSGNIIYNPETHNQIKAVPVGSTIINFYATVGKIVDYYEVRIQQFDGIATDFGSQFFKRVNCCRSDVEFYFLNEYGGRDAILFTQVDSIELEQSNAVFESFLDCEDPNALAGGKSIIDQSATDVFEVTSKFVNDYNTRKWLREFLTSPQKAVRTTIQNESEILSNVVVVNGSVQYYSKDESIFIRLQYILNESINLQKN